MSTHLTIRQQLLEKFRSRKRRRTFAEQDVGSTVAAQIYVMREKHAMTQEELAQRTEMSQARISVLENPNYRKLNVGTLQRIAAAFDVALIVRFVSFGELLDWTVTGSQQTIAPLSFDEEFPEVEAPSPVSSRDNVIRLLDWIVPKVSGQQEPTPMPNQYQAALFDDARKRSSGLLVTSSITPAPAAGTSHDAIQKLQSQTTHTDTFSKQIAVPESGVGR